MGIESQEQEIETGATTETVQKMFGIEGKWTVNNYRQMDSKIAEAIKSEERHIEDNLTNFDEIKANIKELENGMRGSNSKKEINPVLDGLFKDINKIMQLLNGVIESKSLIQETLITQNQSKTKLLEDAENAGLITKEYEAKMRELGLLLDYLKKLADTVRQQGEDNIKAQKNEIIEVIKSSKEPIDNYIRPVRESMNNMDGRLNEALERISALESTTEELASRETEQQEEQTKKPKKEFNLAYELEKIVKEGCDDIYDAKEKLNDIAPSGTFVSLNQIRKNSWKELVAKYSKKKGKTEDEDDEDDEEDEEGDK